MTRAPLADVVAITWATARVLANVGLCCLLAFACATLSDGLLRALFNHPLEAVRDLGPVLVACCMSACFPLAILEKSNIRIRLFSSSLSVAVRRWIEISVESLTLVTLAGIARQLFIYAGNMQEGGDSTVMLEVPLAPFWYVVSLMLLLAAIAQSLMLAHHVLSGDEHHWAADPHGGHT